MAKDIVIKGARENNLKGYRRDDTQRQTGGADRAVGFREVVAGLRYHICGGTAEIHGKSVLLRETISGADGKT